MKKITHTIENNVKEFIRFIRFNTESTWIAFKEGKKAYEKKRIDDINMKNLVENLNNKDFRGMDKKHDWYVGTLQVPLMRQDKTEIDGE